MHTRKLCISVIRLASCVFQAQRGSMSAAQSPRATEAALKQETADDQMVKNVGKSGTGIKMTVESNVADVEDIQAVLIPGPLAKMIFGKGVADNNAVVEVIVVKRGYICS